VAALERSRELTALGSDSAREVYKPLFEALNWAHALRDTWFRLVEPQNRHLDGLRHVRDRCHHQLAAAIYPDAGAHGAGAGGRSLISHPRIAVAATTVRARELHRVTRTTAGARDARDVLRAAANGDVVASSLNDKLDGWRTPGSVPGVRQRYASPTGSPR